MKKIYKYRIAIEATQSIFMPAGAQLLTVMKQHIGYDYHAAFVWALIDTDAPAEMRELHIYGTGHDMPQAPGRYIGTVQLDEFVWHVFDPNDIEMNLPRLRKVDIAEGDLLVAQFKGAISHTTAEKIKHIFKHELPEGVKVIVSDESLEDIIVLAKAKQDGPKAN